MIFTVNFLTAHQKEIYEQFVLDDLSLGEIAADAGISRQGVHDIVKRCARSLEEYERKLHLVEKFLAVKEKVSCIDEILQEWEEEKENPEEIIERLRKIVGNDHRRIVNIVVYDGKKKDDHGRCKSKM